MSVFLNVSLPYFHRIVDAGDVEVTTPMTSTFVFGVALFTSAIVLK